MDITFPQLALLLSRVPDVGPRATMRVLARATAGWDILSASVEELQDTCSLRLPAAEYLASNTSTLLQESQDLLAKVTALGIHIITIYDERYPASLKAYQKALPPVLYAYGNLGLLQERTFAVVSSTTVSGRGSMAASEIAAALVEEGLTPVTGHNNRPYQIPLLAAKRIRAPVLIVLDRGVVSAFHGLMDWQPAAAARIWDPQFDRDRDLALSQFRLGDHWIGANSRLRDKMVFGLADIVIACEIRAGGVMERECLVAKSRGREIYVCSFGQDEPEGNKALLHAGLQPLDAADPRPHLAPLYIAPMFEGRSDDHAQSDDP